jgi:hypothetical protein
LVQGCAGGSPADGLRVFPAHAVHLTRSCRDGAAGRCRESEGIPQSHTCSSPKIGGSRGLTLNMETSAADFGTTLSALHQDSRFHKNGRRGCEGFFPAGGLGVSPISSTLPQEWGIKGVDALSWDGTVRRPPIDKVSLWRTEWWRRSGLS